MAHAMLHAWYDRTLPAPWKAHTPANTPDEILGQCRQQTVPQRLTSQQEVRSSDLVLQSS